MLLLRGLEHGESWKHRHSVRRQAHRRWKVSDGYARSCACAAAGPPVDLACGLERRAALCGRHAFREPPRELPLDPPCDPPDDSSWTSGFSASDVDRRLGERGQLLVGVAFLVQRLLEERACSS